MDARSFAGVRAVNLENLPRGLQADRIGGVDDWNRNWKLGVVFEAKVAVRADCWCVRSVDPGKQPKSGRAATAGVRCWITWLGKINSIRRRKFHTVEFSGLHFDSRVMSRLGATAQADGENAGAAIDGDSETQPYWLVVRSLSGILYDTRLRW